MLPRLPACCRAVPRHLFPPSDSVWVSDEALFIAFQRFCATSRTSRRYGSSVPGPMESRRRMGKRRMTQVSEASPTPSSNLGSIWGSFVDADTTQWQWQAPTTRAPKQDTNKPTLPAWLLEWETNHQEDESESIEVTYETPIERTTTVEDDIRRFRKSIKMASSGQSVKNLSAQYSQQFKQSLTLGLVSSETLSFALRQLSVDIREEVPNTKSASGICLALYTAAWEGIEACKVLRPADFSGVVMNEYVSLLASLPVTHGMQALAHRVLHSTTITQLHAMDQGISSLLKAWSHSWLESQPREACTGDIQYAESLVTEAEDRVGKAQTFAMALKQDPHYERELVMAREAISEAYASVSSAIDATVKVEDILNPLRASAKLLASAVGNLPRKLLSKLLRSCSTHIMTVCKGKEKSSWEYRYCWLSAVAQMPNVDGQLLVQTWQQLDRSNSFNTNKCIEVVLSHWISQGEVKRAGAVRNTFEASIQSHGESDFALLLLAIDKHREMFLTKTRKLFDLLHKLGRYQQVSHILSRMRELDLKVTVHLLGSSVEKMSAYDTKRALSMYHLPFHMRLGYPLRLDWIPNFVLALINDPQIPPKEIWKLLRIPIYEEAGSFQPHFARPLPPTMIILLQKMAIAFARSEARPPRVAFRNVIQCLHHLRIHGAPILPELTRAIGHAGITRSIIRKQFIGQERLQYALSLIAEVEGKAVADKADAAVFRWRQYLTEIREGQKREGNPLRVGPID